MGENRGYPRGAREAGVSPMAAETFEERPRVGDRVKLVGDHGNAGSVGVYIADRAFYEGGDTLPVVRIEGLNSRFEVFVRDPDNQMRKL